MSASRIGLAVALSPLAGAAFAAPNAEYMAIRDILHLVRLERSDPTRCSGWVGPARTHARALADESCATGFRLAGIHGVNLAIWGLLKVANVALHRHGCAAHAREALAEARQILLDTPEVCFGGPERDAALRGMDKALEAADDLEEGIPAANPDLYAPPGETDNRCASESPPQAQIKAKAQYYLDNKALPSGHHADPGSVVITCDPDDPEEVWRATFQVTPSPPSPPSPPGPPYPETAYVNFTTWKCGLSSNPGENCE